MMRRRGVALIASVLVAPMVFALGAVCLRLHWSRSGKYPLTGDEPHYLVASRSLWVYRSIEMSAAYRDAVRRQLFYHWPSFGVAALHNVRTANGLFTVHDLGLPFIFGPAVMLNGSAGARAVMLAIALSMPVLVYLTLRVEGCNPTRSALFAVALSVSPLLLVYSTSIYPDLPAGVIAAGVLVLVLRRAKLQIVERRSVRVLALASVALMPWLNVRVVVLAPILAGALIFMRRKPDPRSVAVEGGLILSSIAAYFAYNLIVFGRLSPYAHVGDMFGSARAALTVFVGLNVDRFQGMFVAQPALLLAFLGTALLLRRYRDVGLLTLALYVVILGSNVPHGGWGGSAFVGRYGLSAAVVLLIPAAVGLATVARRVAAGAFALAFGAVVLNTWQFARIWRGDLVLRNQPPREPRSLYPSWLPMLGRSLPAVNYVSWGRTFAPNYVVPAALITLAIGCGVLVGARKRAGTVIVVLAVVAFVIPTASATPTLSQDVAVLRAGEFGRHTGRVTDGLVEAQPGRDRQGLLAFGPGFPMSGKSVWFAIAHYSSPASSDVQVGAYHLTIGTTQWCDVPLRGTNSHMSTVILRWRNRGGAPESLELGVHYRGTATMRLGSVIISREHPQMPSRLCTFPN